MKGRSASTTAASASVVISVRAKPRSSVSTLERDSTGNWVARLVSPPVEGKANAELVGLVAKRFGCAKAAVSVLSGASGRTKLVKIVGAYAEQANGAA